MMLLVWILAGLAGLFGFVVAFGAPYLPSLRGEVRKAFTTLYPLKKDDVVIDLGSGDGVVLLEATRRGAHGYGYELNPALVLLSRLRLRGRAKIHLANMWKIELPPDTTLVYVFSVSRDVSRLATFLENEATRLKRPLMVMIFGAGLPDRKPKATLKAHSLYEIKPRV